MFVWTFPTAHAQMFKNVFYGYYGKMLGILSNCVYLLCDYDNVIKWKHFLCYWPFVMGIHWSPVNSHHKCQWHGALMFSLICAWSNGWVNTSDAGDLRRHRAHYDVTVKRFEKLAISNQVPSKMWDKITYPFPNLNGTIIEGWEWIDDFTPHFMMGVITNLCWD